MRASVKTCVSVRKDRLLLPLIEVVCAIAQRRTARVCRRAITRFLPLRCIADSLRWGRENDENSSFSKGLGLAGKFFPLSTCLLLASFYCRSRGKCGSLIFIKIVIFERITLLVIGTAFHESILQEESGRTKLFLPLLCTFR